MIVPVYKVIFGINMIGANIFTMIDIYYFKNFPVYSWLLVSV